MKYVSSDFYCLNCGEKNIPIYRKAGQGRGKEHRKKMYCPWCKNECSMMEIRTDEEAEDFKQRFEAGEFIEEAKESIEYVKTHNLRYLL